MGRGAFLLLLATLASGCRERDCKEGTLLVEVRYPSGVDQITIDVTLDGGARATGVLHASAGSTSGTAEVDFNAYPAGVTATVSLRALMGGGVVAGKTQAFTLAAGCTRASILLDASELDGGSDGPLSEDQAGPSCDAGTHYCGANLMACVDDTSPDHCLTSCDPCPSTAHGVPTCTASGCGFMCDSGFAPTGAGCDVIAPQPIYPTSNTITSSTAPAFEWKLAPGTDGAHLQICGDHACTSVLFETDVSGSTYTPSALSSKKVMFWRVAGRVGAVRGATYGATWTFQTLQAAQSNKTAWGRLSDINDDGYADFVIGDDAALTSGAKGSIYVHYGGMSGPAASAATIFAGGGADERFGASVAIVGDTDGDGYADVVVGSYQAGKAYYFRGGSSGLDTLNGKTLTSAATNGDAEFGYRVAAAGDLNGDGYADVVVGGDTTSQGIWIFYGGPSGLAATPSVSLNVPAGASWFGTAIAGAGDVNRDGYGDLVAGDLGASVVYVYLGSATGVPVVASQTIPAPGAAVAFGLAVAGVGDLDGDGYADIMATSQTAKLAWYFRGISTGINPTAVRSVPSGGPGPTSYGQWVGCVGDVNGDGFPDVIVTTNNNATQNLHLTSAGGLNPNATSLTVPANSGYMAAGGGDVNGDGYSDFLISTPQGTAGSAQLFLGAMSVPTSPSGALSDTSITGRYSISVQ